jgi:hypothetical protein
MATTQGVALSATDDGPLPDVLARLAHDAPPPPTRIATSAATRITGVVLSALIFVVVILMGTGQLL